MYTALYRRFRPKNFDEVVGQDAIVTALKNQIKNNMISHAYLFTGSRGTGKTSMAKIFAKAVNCLEPTGGNPCNHCKNCRDITNGNNMDIIEIDAASNNGVNNIRELREDVKYLPSMGRYRVYIIDEVHMLSQGAFNALLKTLEEPPAYIIFILATTDPQKVPVTISSRCQRYDFKRIPVRDIEERLMFVCEKVNVTLDPDAGELIARKAEGALRDALSILDECIAFCDGKISREDVLEILGITDEDVLTDTIAAIADRNVSQCVDIVDNEYMNGRDPVQFARDLVMVMRNLLFITTVGINKGMIDLPESEYKSLEELSHSISTRRIVKMMDVFIEAENSLKYSSQPLIVLETILIKLCLDDVKTAGKDTEKRSTATDLQPKRAIKKAGRKAKGKNIKNIVGENDNNKRKDKSEVKSSEVRTAEFKNDHDDNMEKIKSAWPAILSAVKQNSMKLCSYLSMGTLKGISGGRIKIYFNKNDSFFADELKKQENKEIIENIIKENTGADLKIECIIEKEKKREDDFMVKVHEVFKGMDDKINIME